ncbi:hypothetical protein Taro_049987 [Colocasia esculenta]|uniref:Uncharacterized protein n=1 Tax=Colocasia esculenta TaxID=4460 RepID=A0A843XCK8_COLES|nr:hypothetical protein [Colocasia esculenta]
MAGERQDAASGEASASITGPPRVTFPDAFRNQRSNIAPMKLEVEESAEAMSPRNMWQARFFPFSSHRLLHLSVATLVPSLHRCRFVLRAISLSLGLYHVTQN